MRELEKQKQNKRKHMQATDIQDYYDKFGLKVLSCELGTSQVKQDAVTGETKGGNPMWTVDLEFFNNPPLRVKEPTTGERVEVNVDGLQVRTWLVKLPSTMDMVNNFLISIGLEPVKHPSQLDQLDGNMFIGKTCEAMVRFKARPVKNSNGEPVLHNGKPVTTGERRIDMFLPKSN